MKKDTDLTLFWLAWRKTCAIRLCCPEHARAFAEKCADAPELRAQMVRVHELAAGVLSSMDDHFRKLLGDEDRGARVSEYDAEAQGWKAGLGGGSAFELVEAYLYNKETIKGKAFKAYLFEDAAGRPGGMSKNLFGYLQRVMASMLRESYGENVYLPAQDADGRDIEPSRISLDGQREARGEHTPDECAEAHEVEAAFQDYLRSHGAEWDADRWLVLYCMLNVIRVGSASVQPLFQKGHQTINEWFSEMRDELLSLLRSAFSDGAIGMALDGRVQAILDEKVRAMPWYDAIRKILEENRKSTGK